MSGSYHQLVVRIADRYGVSPEAVDRRTGSRSGRLFGLVGLFGKSAVARTVAASLAIGVAERRLADFLAAGARHVSGLEIADAMAAARLEAAQQRLCSLGYWPQPQDTPQTITSQCMVAIEALAEAGLGGSVSIKADQLGYDRALVRSLARYARAHRVRLHFDAQGFDSTDRTHAMLEDALGLGADVSGTLPSRWVRSVHDAERFIELGLPVRVVKGQGADPDHPKIDPRRSFLALVDVLAGRAAHVGVATHDRRTAEPALDRLVARGTPCSLEQLRSLPRLDFLADARGLPTRAYIAYGRFGLPYAVGEALRRPAVLGWILRDLLVRRLPAARTGLAP